MTEGNWMQRTQGKKWLLLFIIAFINILIIELIVLTIEPYWGDFNQELANFIGWEGDYVLILLCIILIPVIYAGVMVVINFKRFIHTKQTRPHLINKILPLIVLILFDMLLVVLVYFFGEEAAILNAILENFSIFIFIVINIGLFILLYPILSYLRKVLKGSSSKGGNTRIKAIGILICIVIGYGVAFNLPFLFKPTNIISGNLPEKPKIIAHRGAAHLAPENTIIAADVAYNLSCDGWEIDVQISRDGIPFLMHDDTLKRTTNVAEIFPGRENEAAANFTITELEQLNAGKWFVEQDPYRAIAKGLVSQAQVEFYRINASIPTLEEVLNFTKDHNLLLDVDFKTPPADHPYHVEYFNICLSLLNASGLDKKIWVTAWSQSWLDIALLYTNLTVAWSISSSDPPTIAFNNDKQMLKYST